LFRGGTRWNEDEEERAVGAREEAVDIFSNISATVIGEFLVASSNLATFNKCILLAKKYDVLSWEDRAIVFDLTSTR